MQNIHKNNTLKLDTYIFSADWIHSNEFLDFNILSEENLIVCKVVIIYRSFLKKFVVVWIFLVEAGNSVESLTCELSLRLIPRKVERRSSSSISVESVVHQEEGRRSFFDHVTLVSANRHGSGKYTNCNRQQNKREQKQRFHFKNFLVFLKLRFNLIRSRSLTERNVSGISLFYRTDFDFRFLGC